MLSKAIRWASLALLLFPLGTYVLLILINAKDEPPSVLVQSFGDAINQNEQLLSSNLENNGYIFALGFHAPQGTSPQQVGLKRLNDLQVHGVLAKFESTQTSFAVPPLPLDACFMPQEAPQACLAELAKMDNLAQVLEEQAWLIERYQQMLALQQWQDTSASGAFGHDVVASRVLAGQKLYLLNLYARVDILSAQQLADALEMDMKFWQQAASNSHKLITKLISHSAMVHHFRLGRLTIASLGTDKQYAATPNSWQQGIPSSVTSLKNAKVGEWRYFKETLAVKKAMDEDAGLNVKILSAILAPLMQTQDTLNRRAAMLEDYQSQSYCQLESSLAMIQAFAYNPVGKYILCTGTTPIEQYQAPMAQLEHNRTQALTRF